MADRMAVMHAGLVERIGARLDVYDRPKTSFVAPSIGSPSLNIFTHAHDRRRADR